MDVSTSGESYCLDTAKVARVRYKTQMLGRDSIQHKANSANVAAAGADAWG